MHGFGKNGAGSPGGGAITRRTLLAGAAAGAAWRVGRQPSAAAQGTPAAGGRAVAHAFGATEVPENPRRVVTVGLSDHDYLLALGVVPVGLTDWYGDQPYGVWPWAQDELGDAAPTVMPRNDDLFNYETIADLQPDLIIGLYAGMEEDEYATLSAIAPTVAPSGDFPDYGMPWDVTARTVGQAVNREAEAEAVIADVESRFAAAREAHPGFAGESAVVAEYFDTFFVRSATDPRTRFLTSLGFVLPEEIADLTGDLDGAEISEERLELLDRDLLLWNAGFAPELADELAANPIYQGLDVAREGRDIVLVDPILSGALTWSTVLSLPYALDGLLPLLAAASDGDPATVATPVAA